MAADVEQVRFDTAAGFLRVVEQQGRVTLAAERNAQVDILLHQIRALAVDLIGPRGTPAHRDETGAWRPGSGFSIGEPPLDDGPFGIFPGHYWVNGRLCELAERTSYLTQPYHRPAERPGPGKYLVYLDVWERHVGAAEDPGLLEPALGGPDTCSRTQLVWQAKVLTEQELADRTVTDLTPDGVRAKWAAVEDGFGPLAAAGRLSARVDRTARDPRPCLAAPSAGYTGGENQLIRVEVFAGGPAGTATFTWAYDNASVEHRLLRVDGTSVVLSAPPFDLRKGFEVGTRVEVLSDDQVRDGARGTLSTVVEVVDDADDYGLRLEHPVPFARDGDDGRWALLRRWDHTAVELAADGARTITEGTPLTLDAGVQVTFVPPSGPDAPAAWTYRPGDHWTVPVRTAVGDVLWPRDPDGKPVARPPQGVEHSYAPLAIIDVTTGAYSVADVRESIEPIAKALA